MHMRIQHLIDILHQFLQLFMQYLTILECIIMTLNCSTLKKKSYVADDI